MSASYPPPPPLAAAPPPTPPPVRYAAAPLPASPRYAGFWRRFFALLVDAILFSVLYGLVAFAGQWGTNMALGTVVFSSPTGPEELLSRANLALSGLLGLLALCYFVLTECSRWQGTPGKRLLHIRVTDLQGRRISFFRALFRNLFKGLSAAVCLIGYLVVAVGARKQAFHDMIAGCVMPVR